MIKVCHITSAHNNRDVRIFFKECTSLARAGYEIYLVAAGENREENGVSVVGIGLPSGGRLARIAAFSRKIYEKALELNADIYHLHDPELLPYALKLKAKGKIVIFDSHEDTLNQMQEKKWIPVLIRPLVSAVYKRYARRVFGRIDALIAVTPHIYDKLKQINNNTWLVTNYPIYENNKLDPVKTQTDVFKICFAGGIDEQWCHSNIIEAVDGMECVRYYLCGSAEQTYLSLIKKLPGWVNVDYRGILPHEEAQMLQRSSNVGMALLKPSRNTGGMLGTLGNTKLFEYMMNGIPVICTGFEYWKDIVDTYECGISVDPNSTEEIKAAIKYLFENPDVAFKMGQNGRKAVELRFNWETQEKELLELYQYLLSCKYCYKKS